MSPLRSAILTYHSIDTSGSVISIAPQTFRSQMKSLAESGTVVVDLAEVAKHPGSVAITFDDGFQNFYEEAFPVLQQYGFPATVFVVSGFVGKRNDWPSQPSTGIPRFELMGWDEIKEVSRHGVALGAHTVSHPFMTRNSKAENDTELKVCRSEIESRTGTAVSTFAYPYGDFDHHVQDQVAGYFRVACTTVLDYVEAPHPLALPRLDIYYLQKTFWFDRLGTALGRQYIAARRNMRQLRRRSPAASGTSTDRSSAKHSIGRE
jgi:peptidoglycan/xylan/chitin deacetylase (PgdA/CDA1 family)